MITGADLTVHRCARCRSTAVDRQFTFAAMRWECRINAEDPPPSAKSANHLLYAPVVGAVDPRIYAGYTVPPYDSTDR